MEAEDEEESKHKCPEGTPAWVMTFADLMSLLMCFFVLLLSFSEINVELYKQLAGSMKMAFGVQRSVNAHDIPMGTSIIAKNFSPGKPEPTILDQVRQEASDIESDKLNKPSGDSQETQSEARKIAAALRSEISAGKVEIETVQNNIVIRLKDKGVFQSGTATIDASFAPVIKKIQSSIANIQGEIEVSGHTDDFPISTPQFRSNWELSTARAVSIAHALMDNGTIPENRFQIVGHADTQPLVPNTDDKNRAQNRRVEVIIKQKHDVTDILNFELQVGE